MDHTTVGKAIADLHGRFGFNRLVFVGDRGMVTSDNLDAITAGNHGYLVGLKRRRNKKLDKWLAAVDEAKWINCPVGVAARRSMRRAPGLGSFPGDRRHGVIIVNSDKAPACEEAMRVKSMEQTRQALSTALAAGKLKQPEKIGTRPSGCCSGAMATAIFLGAIARGASGTSRTRQAWGARRGSKVNM